MISSFDLYEFASRIIMAAAPLEGDLRRAISSLYYSLFHRLTATGAKAFAAGGKDLQRQTARSFNHGPMRKVCEQFARSKGGQPLRAPIGRMIPSGPHPALVAVAEAFILLQDARTDADYDIEASVTQQHGVEMLRVAEQAHRRFTEVEGLPETIVFLTALLLADRWSRVG